MPIAAGSLIESTIVMAAFSMQTLNVWQYEVASMPLSVTAAQIAEAYWNNIKNNYRALSGISLGATFKSVRIRELNNPTGDFGEYAIPLAEQTGTRATPTPNDAMPPFCAAGVRLVVGTRATRPGQKRFPFLYEVDQVSGGLLTSYITPLNTLMAQMSTSMLLGAPAATASIFPIVVRKDSSGAVTAHQTFNTFLVNFNVTTQNTRKFGRGA